MLIYQTVIFKIKLIYDHDRSLIIIDQNRQSQSIIIDNLQLKPVNFELFSKNYELRLKSSRLEPILCEKFFFSLSFA